MIISTRSLLLLLCLCCSSSINKIVASNPQHHAEESLSSPAALQEEQSQHRRQQDEDAGAAAAADFAPEHLPDNVRNIKPSYNFNDLEKAQNEGGEDRDHQNGDGSRRYIVKYKKKFAATNKSKVGVPPPPAADNGPSSADSGRTKLASRQNNILLESTKVLSLEEINADVVMLHSESQLLQLQSDENVELVERGMFNYYFTILLFFSFPFDLHG